LLKNTTKIVLEHLDAALPEDLRIFWPRAAQAAAARGWNLYLVGGAVRDLLLAQDHPVLIPDLDLVVSAEPVTPAGAAIELAQDLQAFYPASRLADRPLFQTATLHCGPDGPVIDLATARIETYAYPGSHPTVTAGSIYQDLQRRDFTINAMALCLTGPAAGEIVDFFGGMVDLEARLLRVLHDRSFQDDPTRLWRGVRFLTRLDLGWAPETEQQWRETLASGVFAATLDRFEKVPSLQTRLLAELKYLLTHDRWRSGVDQLQEIDGWRCLHPNLEINANTYGRLQQLELQGSQLDRSKQLELPPAWLMRLETILAELNLLDRQIAAEQLQMPVESVQRLSQLEVVERVLGSVAESKPSAVSIALATYSTPLLFQAMLRIRDEHSALIWQYLTDWSQVTAPLDGKDLKELGYPPGATYKIMLQDLLGATRDGLVIDHQSALDFLGHHYPLSP
jgi:tRNA nucleotidyltransferase (CCA-adding enzyme)